MYVKFKECQEIFPEKRNRYGKVMKFQCSKKHKVCYIKLKCRRDETETCSKNKISVLQSINKPLRSSHIARSKNTYKKYINQRSRIITMYVYFSYDKQKQQDCLHRSSRDKCEQHIIDRKNITVLQKPIFFCSPSA